MKCPLCGCENLTGAVYCDECGASLKRPQSTAVTHSNATNISSVFPTPGSSFVAAPPPSPATAFAPAPPPTPAAPPVPTPAPAPAPMNYVRLEPTRILDTPQNYIYAKLSVIGENHEFPLSAEKVILGRGPAQPGEGFKFNLSNVKDGDTISKRHAVISCDSLGIYIEDLGSGNGTFINGEKIAQGLQRELRGGEEVRLGAARFTFTRLK